MKTNAGNDRFKILHNGVASKKGCTLISEPFLSEVCFQRSVIMLTSHNEEEGSMGFILNKPTGIFLSSFFPGIKTGKEIPVFLGGPVGSDKLFFLHTLGDILPDSLHIYKEIYMNGNFDTICDYINNENPVEGKIKFFLGYSGWTSGQLEEEIKENT
ncbi:MAG: YqgE/AlgH family protein [Candidatus Azobacteroides sp.]|nr:YqgE/AlgH family protein [Candidatus Azobacteroides sp.]